MAALSKTHCAADSPVEPMALRFASRCQWKLAILKQQDKLPARMQVRNSRTSAAGHTSTPRPACRDRGTWFGGAVCCGFLQAQSCVLELNITFIVFTRLTSGTRRNLIKFGLGIVGTVYSVGHYAGDPRAVTRLENRNTAPETRCSYPKEETLVQQLQYFRCSYTPGLSFCMVRRKKMRS